MTRFRHRPLEVTAVQWFPGVDLPGYAIYTQPKQLVGLWWAHLGHQRMLKEGHFGLLKPPNGDPLHLHPGNWIVTDRYGQWRVLPHERFIADFESVDSGKSPGLPTVP